MAAKAKAASSEPAWSEAVVEHDDDDDDEDEESGEEEEGEEESGEEEASGEESEGDGEEELEYFREDGEEDQEDDEDDSSDEEESGEDGEEDGDEAADGKEEAAAASGESTQPAAEETAAEDEMPINTVGNIPLEWYDDFDHVGYDLDGQKIMRGARKDELDALIQRMDDPNASRTVHDYLHGVDVVLSEEDIALIKRLQKHRFPDPNMNPYPDAVHHEWADKLHPLSQAPPRKAPFIPSKWEAKKVMKLVMAMRSEQYQKSVENRRKQDAKDKPDYQYLIWDEKSNEEVKHHKRLPPPKMALPTDAEVTTRPLSIYSPRRRGQPGRRWTRPTGRPTLYRRGMTRCARCRSTTISSRSGLIAASTCTSARGSARTSSTSTPIRSSLSCQSRRSCGRTRSANPSSLPDIPEGSTRSVSPDGNSLLTAGQDGTVRLWEVSTARCERKWSFGKEEVRHVAFNPSGELDMAVCAVGPKVYLMLPNATGKSSKAADRSHALLSGSDKECGAWVAVASSPHGHASLGGDGRYSVGDGPPEDGNIRRVASRR